MLHGIGNRVSVVGNLENNKFGSNFSTPAAAEATQRTLDAKMDAINERLNKLGEKYEKIKQLEEQMKESNEILELLLERR